MSIDVTQARGEALAVHGLRGLGCRRVKERTETSHLHLTRNKIEPRLQLRALEFAVRRSELFGGHLVGDVLHNRRSLGEDSAIIELKGRHEA